MLEEYLSSKFLAENPDCLPFVHYQGQSHRSMEKEAEVAS